MSPNIISTALGVIIGGGATAMVFILRRIHRDAFPILRQSFEPHPGSLPRPCTREEMDAFIDREVAEGRLKTTGSYFGKHPAVGIIPGTVHQGVILTDARSRDDYTVSPADQNAARLDKGPAPYHRKEQP